MAGIETQEMKAYAYANILNSSQVEARLNAASVKYTRYALAGSQSLYYYEIYTSDSDLNAIQCSLAGYGLVTREFLPILNPAVSQEILTIERFNSLTGTIPNVFAILPAGLNGRSWVMPNYKATTAGAGSVSLAFGAGSFYDIIPAAATSVLTIPFTSYCNQQPTAILAGITSSSCTIITERTNRCQSILPYLTGLGVVTVGALGNATDGNTATSVTCGGGINIYLHIDMGANYSGNVSWMGTPDTTWNINISLDDINWVNIATGIAGAQAAYYPIVYLARYIQYETFGIGSIASLINEICFWHL